MKRIRIAPVDGQVSIVICAVAFVCLMRSAAIAANFYDLSSTDVVIAFANRNPSFTFSFNKTTYGAEQTFYTKNNPRTLKIDDKSYPVPQSFTNFANNSFNYCHVLTPNASVVNCTQVYSGNFSTALLDGQGQPIAQMAASTLLFENATTYNFSVGGPNGLAPQPLIYPGFLSSLFSDTNDNNNASAFHFSLPLSDGAAVLFTKFSQWNFATADSRITLYADVVSLTSPLDVSMSRYGPPTNNIRKVSLQGGVRGINIFLSNNVTMYCGGVLKSAYIDINYSIGSVVSPISAVISIGFPTFGEVFGNETAMNCTGNNLDNYIEYHGYMNLIDAASPVSWILVAACIGGGALLLCCLLIIVFFVWRYYNKIMAGHIEEQKQRKHEKLLKEEARAERKQQQKSYVEIDHSGQENVMEEGSRRRTPTSAASSTKKGETYVPGYYDFLLRTDNNKGKAIE